MATAGYWFGMAARSAFANRTSAALTWSASAMGSIGLMVRWYESYLISPDVGHIPLSNLYEVFILFAVMTALLYLYYEERYNNRQMGAFVLPVITAAVAFILWYTFGREAHHIQPLVPALQSYWMKLHVPTNFIGYGAFALAAMIGVAYLLANKGRLAGGYAPEVRRRDAKAIAIGFTFHHRHHPRRHGGGGGVGRLLVMGLRETWALIVWLNYAAGYIRW
jgi:ABC-type transport system involved in cytochrome c biogenesis permease subunit